MSLIKNASPQVIFLGTDDKSTRTILPEPDPIPTHLPLFYIYAEKGPAKRMLTTNAKFTTIFGSKTVDQNEKFFNHQTRFLYDILGQSNTCMVERLIPDDAGVRANAVIYMDILKTKIPNYVRDSYGGYVTDEATGEWKVYEKKPWVDGHKIKFIKEVLDTDGTKGRLRPKEGTMQLLTKFTEVIPDAQKVSILNFKDKYKIGDEITFNFNKDYTRTDHEVSVSSPDIVEINDEGKLIAKATGKCNITLKIKNGEDSYSIKFTVTVVSTDVNPAGVVALTNLTQILDKAIPEAHTTINAEQPDNVVVTSSAPNIVKVEENRKLIARSNGVALIYVKAPATATSEATTTVYSVQSKIPGLPEKEIVAKSTMYPLFEIKAKHHGAYYNNLGFSLFSVFGEEQNPTLNKEVKTLIFKLGLYVKPDGKTTPDVYRTLYGDPAITFSFKEKAVNPDTDGRVDFEHLFESSFFNEEDQLLPLKLWDYEYFHFYRNYYEDVCSMLLDLEKRYVREQDEIWGDDKPGDTLTWFDFTTTEEEELGKQIYLLNPFVCRSSKNVNYFTIVKEQESRVSTDKQKEVLLNGDTPIFLEGGNDGTTTDLDAFEAAVVSKIKEYADIDSKVHDLAVNVESIFYDTGFSLPTKKELCNFISVRKDTALILTTFDWKNRHKQYSLQDIRSIGEALKARLKLCPESEFYGTPVARGLVTMGGGKLKKDADQGYKSTSYEIALKAAKMMGSGSGRWDTTQLFDNYPGNAVNYLTDIYPEFLPHSVKPSLWNDGLVWAQPYDLKSFHFPALQTVYDNDTSVLNNFFVMMGLCEVVKIGDRVWRKFTGTGSMKPDQFTRAVQEYATGLLSGKFGGIITVNPEVFLTAEDELRGYSWHITFKIFGDNLKTVCVITTETYRSTDE